MTWITAFCPCQNKLPHERHTWLQTDHGWLVCEGIPFGAKQKESRFPVSREPALPLELPEEENSMVNPQTPPDKEETDA